MKPQLILILIISVISIFLTSCGESTNPQKCLLSGIIYLDGQTDHSGITVMLFLADLVPGEVKDINETYSQVAFPVRDVHLFDHRDYPELQTTLTGNDGSFSFQEIEYGNYIVAYYKEGWGFNYVFDVILNAPTVSLNDFSKKNSIELYPQTIIPAVISGSFECETDRCYIIDQDVIAVEGSHLIINADSRILINPSKKLTILGLVTSPSNESFAYITAASSIYGGINPQVINGDGVTIISGVDILHNIVFSYLNNSLSIRKSNTNISMLVVRNCVYGVQFNQVNDVSLSGSWIAQNTIIDGASVYGYSVQGLIVENNIFSDNYISLKNEVVTNSLIENNAFIGGSREFLNLWESTAVFRHNLVKNAGIGLENSGRSNLEIYYNAITSNSCINTYYTANWGDSPTQGWVKANYNNLSSEKRVVDCRSVYYNNAQPLQLNFENNWWGSNIISIIEGLIIDFYDLPPHDTSSGGNYGIVDYSPFRASSVIGAGIQ